MVLVEVIKFVIDVDGSGHFFLDIKLDGPLCARRNFLLDALVVGVARQRAIVYGLVLDDRGGSRLQNDAKWDEDYAYDKKRADYPLRTKKHVDGLKKAR